jgi:16S rRNA A1518/A1519 N6-dimethyltransferase RsmA/KsgA/DIM1 with predicted DNA glycosylase/AP lyase activity
VNGRRVRAALAQNFFRRHQTVKGFVRLAGLDSRDLVYDLGAGSGMITRELAATGARVVAVECDPNLAKILHRRFQSMANVAVCESDVMHVAFDPPFKVVANIPFNQTAAILRRLYFDAPSPCEAFIVLQREAAEKFAGIGRNSAVSLMHTSSYRARVSLLSYCAFSRGPSDCFRSPRGNVGKPLSAIRFVAPKPMQGRLFVMC